MLSNVPSSRMESSMAGAPLLCVVDDDESVRESLPDMLRSFGFAVEAFASAEDFLRSDVASRTSCLILDIRMPGMSGSDLQRELAAQQRHIPIVFITAHAEADDRHRVLDEGAVDCLQMPFSADTLLRAVRAALHA